MPSCTVSYILRITITIHNFVELKAMKSCFYMLLTSFHYVQKAFNNVLHKTFFQYVSTKTTSVCSLDESKSINLTKPFQKTFSSFQTFSILLQRSYFTKWNELSTNFFVGFWDMVDVNSCWFGWESLQIS